MNGIDGVWLGKDNSRIGTGVKIDHLIWKRFGRIAAYLPGRWLPSNACSKEPTSLSAYGFFNLTNRKARRLML